MGALGAELYLVLSSSTKADDGVSDSVWTLHPEDNTLRPQADPTPDCRMSRGRDDFAVYGLAQRLYVVGGRATSAMDSVSAAMDVYDPRRNCWSTGTAMRTARSSLAVKALDGQLLFAVGGRSASEALATVEAYDPATKQWTT
eukprot:COSAG04_NODE_10412_length_779_cov_0.947059_2_plen_142_part_01